MPARDLPARPHLDHLRNEAKTLRRDFAHADAAAIARVSAVLGARPALKLTDAQRVIAREYGFATWAKLRAHVNASQSINEAINTFLAAVENLDRAGALTVLQAEPRIARQSLHVAAALGDEASVRRLIAADRSQIATRAGRSPGEPLLWLCYSPFHGESTARDEGLYQSARALLEAGADPNTTDVRYHVPALYALTGVHNLPRLARLLLDHGANPTDGESIYHAAEKYHIESMELLYSYGVQLNAVGDWGNTPLYFLLRYWDVGALPRVRQGLDWLLDHGADPNLRCGKEQETALHVAARRGQHADVLQLLLERGADVHARRGDGRTAWQLARRAGFAALAGLLEQHGAQPEPLSAADELLAACGRGDVMAAQKLTTADLVAALEPADLRALPEAAASNRADTIVACVAAGFPVNTTDENGATALHFAALHGNVAAIRALVHAGPDLAIRDREHHATPLGWACFGADHVQDVGGDYAAAVRILLDAGARPGPHEPPPAHDGVRAVLQPYLAAGA